MTAREILADGLRREHLARFGIPVAVTWANLQGYEQKLWLDRVTAQYEGAA